MGRTRRCCRCRRVDPPTRQVETDLLERFGEIHKKSRPKVQEAGNKLHGAVREEVEAIVAVIKG
jgi:hypothetical protein